MDRESVDVRSPLADHPPALFFDTERAALALLERETRWVPGLPNQGSFIARSLVYDKIGPVSGRSAVRELLRLGYAYAKGPKWIRITELGAIVARRCRVGGDRHQLRIEADYFSRLQAGAR